MENNNQPIRAVGYSRVSTQEQAQDGYSLAAQRSMIEQYCKLHNLTLIDQYTDEGISGKNIENRPGINYLISDAKAGRFDVVVIWKLSRISRKLMDTLSIMDDLTDFNVSLQSISEKIDIQSNTGKFMIQLLSSVNELERNTLIENVGLGHQAKARNGQWNGGKILGYDNVKMKGKGSILQINKEEAKIVRHIYHSYLQGNGYRSIANSLNNAGYVTKRENSFSSVAVKDILLNPTYKGVIRYGKKAKGIKDLKDNIIETQGEHEPIIPPKTWDKVHQRWQLNSRKPTHNQLGTNILTGIIKCPECGGHMVVSNSSYKLKDGTRKRKQYYVCGAFKNKGKTVCHANGIEVKKAEKKVADRFHELIDSDKLLEHLLAKMQKQTEDSKEQLLKHKRHLQEKIVKTDKHILDYQDRLETEQDLADVWELAIKRLENEKEEYVSKLNVTKQKLNTDSTSLDIEVVSTLMKQLIKKLKTAQTNRELKELYLAFIDEIRWDKESFEFNIKLHFNETNLAEYLTDNPDPTDPFITKTKNNKQNQETPSTDVDGVLLSQPIEMWV